MTDPGLCARCRNAQPIANARGSTFWRCREHDRDPAWPKYPPLPVLRCARFAAANDDAPPTGG
jgi:hypothetical protein